MKEEERKEILKQNLFLFKRGYLTESQYKETKRQLSKKVLRSVFEE